MYIQWNTKYLWFLCLCTSQRQDCTRLVGGVSKHYESFVYRIQKCIVYTIHMTIKKTLCSYCSHEKHFQSINTFVKTYN